LLLAPDVPGKKQPGRAADADRLPVAADSRPPEQTGSSTGHVFLMKEGEYRCSRCGAPSNDRTSNEECPAAS